MTFSGKDSVTVNPAALATANAAWAILLCTFVDIVFSWAGDWLSDSVGNPRTPHAPTWIGAMIVASQKGWPVVGISALCGLFGRNLEGLSPALVATWFLSLIDTTAALIVGLILVLWHRNDQEG